MKGEIDLQDPFDPPRIRPVVPLKVRFARAVSIGLSAISAYAVVAGLITFSFIGSPVGIMVSLAWTIPAAGFAYLAWWLGRREIG